MRAVAAVVSARPRHGRRGAAGRPLRACSTRPRTPPRTPSTPPSSRVAELGRLPRIPAAERRDDSSRETYRAQPDVADAVAAVSSARPST
jgi:hypothetical protein